MERTEPVLVPQWLKGAGNVHGGGSLTHHSDVPSAPSRYLRSNSQKDTSRYQDRNPMFNSRVGSLSNGSAKHPYGSFTRSHRDKNRAGEKEKSFLEDMWDHDSPDLLSGILRRKGERNTLMRSQSLISRKPTEVLPRRMHDLKTSSSLQKGANGVYSGANVLGSIKNEAFPKDFPSLCTEENQGATGVGKIKSPRLASSSKSLPIGNKVFIGGENWTSALAEVPVRANNGIGHSPYPQNSVEKLSESGVSNPAGRNMAEALSQPTEQVRGAPQLQDKNQRLEELAIKQSRQLIPVTPSMPKSLMKAFSSTDKLRQPKVSIRANEINVVSKGTQALPHSSHLSNQHRAGQARASDSSASTHVGKFLVLKPGRENFSTTGAKDLSSSTGEPSVGQLATASASPKCLAVSSTENKADALLLRSKSLARSRSEFFNLMRKKASNGVATRESSLAGLPLNDGSSADSFKVGNTPEISRATGSGGEMIFVADAGLDRPQNVGSFSDESNSNFSGHEAIYIDEEEAAFLRSLGWDENGGEDEGLTEDEIRAFYEEYMSRRPT